MKKYILLSFLIVFTVFVGSVHAENYSFSNDLSVGSSGADVTSLQTWLISNGFDIPSINSGVSSKGYFGSQTKNALIKYQQSVGFPAFGFFGPMTRGYINGQNNQNNNSFKVSSPNGGEVWVKGTTQNITWRGPADVLAQKGDIKLEYPLPACAQPGQIIKCMIMVRAPITIGTSVDLSSRSYAWYVGNQQGLACIPEQPSACEVQPGQYKVQICPADGSTCAESDSTFTISSSTVTSNSAPVINGVDAPTTLSIGQTGTWTVHATDPLNGTLGYQVNWGDVPTFASMDCLSGFTCDPNVGATVASVQQTSVFTHSYNSVGTYTINFYVRNSAGHVARIGSTVVVTSSAQTSNVPDINIISPNGGEVFQAGTNQIVTVNVTGDQTKIGNTISLFLLDSSGNLSNGYSLGSFSSGNTAGQKSFQVKLPSNYLGNDKIYATLSTSSPSRICRPGYLGCVPEPIIQAYDYSDNPFSVTSYEYSNNQCPAGFTCIKNSN